MSMALRSSPLEDSIPYKTVKKGRRPKDTRMALPESYWHSPPRICGEQVAMGACQQWPITGDRCYYHEKIRLGILSVMRGSPFLSNLPHDKMVPNQRPNRGSHKGAHPKGAVDA